MPLTPGTPLLPRTLRPVDCASLTQRNYIKQTHKLYTHSQPPDNNSAIVTPSKPQLRPRNFLSDAESAEPRPHSDARKRTLGLPEFAKCPRACAHFSRCAGSSLPPEVSEGLRTQKQCRDNAQPALHAAPLHRASHLGTEIAAWRCPCPAVTISYLTDIPAIAPPACDSDSKAGESLFLCTHSPIPAPIRLYRSWYHFLIGVTGREWKGLDSNRGCWAFSLLCKGVCGGECTGGGCTLRSHMSESVYTIY